MQEVFTGFKNQWLLEKNIKASQYGKIVKNSKIVRLVKNIKKDT